MMHHPSQRKIALVVMGILAFGLLVSILFLIGLPARNVMAQQPTGSVPTVTGTPPGPYVTVYTDQNEIGVYSGPGFDSYPQVGILVSGQKVPALGRSRDDAWIQITYLGVPGSRAWVYALFVSLTSSTGNLSYVDSPPTATPRTTPTINPTYAAAFGLSLAPTQLPTFTPPSALQIPTFSAGISTGSKLPFGLIILGLMLVGVLVAVVSFLRGSR